MTKIDRSEFIQKPNKKLINSYINRFEKNNSIDESALRKVFKDYDNSSCENILIKTVILNNRYSAGLNDKPSDKERIAIDTLGISKIIHRSFKNPNSITSPDKAIKKLERMCEIVEKKNKNNSISFLSKYFFWTYYTDESSNIAIPIYDSYVKGMLYYLNKRYKYIEPFNQNQIQSYKDFYNIFTETLEAINTELQTEFSTRDFDKYLWQYAKDLSNPDDPDEVPISVRI